MNPKRDLVSIAEAYKGILDQVSQQVVLEEAKKAKKVTAKKGIASGSFEVAPNKINNNPTKSKPFISSPSGPAEASNFRSEIIDTKKKNKKDNFYTPERFSQLKVEKTEATKINTYMSNKSSFDKLFENVMNGGELDSGAGAPGDLDASIDKPETDEDLHGEELGDEEDIHSKLAKALELLHAVQEELQGAEQETDQVEGDIKGEEDLDGDSGGELAGEAIDIKELGDKSAALKKVSGKSNVVGDETDKLTDGSEGDGKVTDKVTGYEKGKEGKPTPVTGKANVVSGKAGKVGNSLFAKSGK